jgi:hypothetical protein
MLLSFTFVIRSRTHDFYGRERLHRNVQKQIMITTEHQTKCRGTLYKVSEYFYNVQIYSHLALPEFPVTEQLGVIIFQQKFTWAYLTDYLKYNSFTPNQHLFCN